jgi:hypothetical protein
VKEMRLEGHVARMERRGMHVGFLSESQKKRDLHAEIDIGRTTTLKFIFQKYDAIVRTGLIWLRIGSNGGLLWAR